MFARKAICENSFAKYDPSDIDCQMLGICDSFAIVEPAHKVFAQFDQISNICRHHESSTFRWHERTAGANMTEGTGRTKDV